MRLTQPCSLNMAALRSRLERVFGHAKIGAIILISGFTGVLWSCCFVPELSGAGLMLHG